MKYFLRFALAFTIALTFPFSNLHVTASNFDSAFEKAYQQYPSIPNGILEVIAYTKTHIRHLDPDKMDASCMGLPSVYGVMGLIKDGKGYLERSGELQGIKT